MGASLRVATFAVSQLTQVGSDLWLADWARATGGDSGSGGALPWRRAAALGATYAALCVAHMAATVAGCLVLVLGAAGASRELHKTCLRTVLGAPLAWFEAEPAGRTLARFGADMNVLDQQAGRRKPV